MKIDIQKYNELINYIKTELSDEKWDYIIFKFLFSKGGRGANCRFFYQNKEFKKVLSVFEYGPLMDNILYDFDKGIKKRDFNEITLKITKSYHEVFYKMDTEREKREQQEREYSSAISFSDFVYESMCTQIYDYEIENRLRTPIRDKEGVIYDYENSWDNVVITFIVDSKTKKVNSKIELALSGIERIVPLKLSDFNAKQILFHHEITHGKLKKHWKPWNKIVVKAPKNACILGKEQEYIEYSFESKEVLKQLLTPYKNNGWNTVKIKNNNINKFWTKLKNLWS